MSEQWVINTPEDLAKVIDGRSDAELNEGIAALGVDQALDKVFEGMEQAFDADAAGGQSAVVQWDIDTPEGRRSYSVKIAEGKCATARGPAESPRVTLQVSTPNFLRIVTGKLSGTQAFFQGQLKLQGDMMFAQTQQNWFRMSAPS